MATSKTISAQAATLEAVNECKKMTGYMMQALTEQEAKQKSYMELLAEWERRQGLYNASLSQYKSKCSSPSGCLTPGSQGGVQRLGCDPMCLNWLRMNPSFAAHKPVAPVPPDLGTFVCSICAQSVDINATAGDAVNVMKNAINQQMTCTTALDKQISDSAAAVPNASGTNAGTPTAPAPVPARSTSVPVTTETAETTTEEEKSNTTMYIIIGAIILTLIIIGIVIALIFSGDAEPAIRTKM